MVTTVAALPYMVTSVPYGWYCPDNIVHIVWSADYGYKCIGGAFDPPFSKHWVLGFSIQTIPPGQNSCPKHDTEEALQEEIFI